MSDAEKKIMRWYHIPFVVLMLPIALIRIWIDKRRKWPTDG